MDQAKDKADLKEEMIEEVEMTAEAVVVVETAEAVAVETVVARAVEEEDKCGFEIADLRFQILKNNKIIKELEIWL